MSELVIATKNAGKIKELEELLAATSFKIKCLAEFPNVVAPAETGASFADNAVIKARSYAFQTQCWTLADDSGLEVAALGGAPGIFSARYAGENAADPDKITKLLKELDEAKLRNRSARFVCAMAVSDADGEIKFLTEGICHGTIAATASGANGFGYDPIFTPAGFQQTFGELPDEIKQKISHRARAMEKITPYLRLF